MLPIIIGNFLHRFNSSLYLMLSPYIIEKFFPPLIQNNSYIEVIFIIYSFSKILKTLSKICGYIFFGYLSLIYTPWNLFTATILGANITILIIGVLPTYNSIGIFAPILLILLRIIQDMLGSGEITLSELYIFAHQKKINLSARQKIKSATIYSFSSMLGIATGAFIIVIIKNIFSESSQLYWRIPFIFTFFTSIYGMYLRTSTKRTNIKKKKVTIPNIKNIFSLIRELHPQILQITFLGAISYSIYTFIFEFLDYFLIPKIGFSSTKEMLNYTPYLLLLDALLHLFIGMLFYKSSFISIKNLTIISLTFFTIIIVPLCRLIFIQNILLLLSIKSVLIALGIIFSIIKNIMSFNLFHRYKEKYLLNSITNILGIEILGRSANVIFFLTFRWTKDFSTSYLYLLFLSVVTLVFTIKNSTNERC